MRFWTILGIVWTVAGTAAAHGTGSVAVISDFHLRYNGRGVMVSSLEAVAENDVHLQNFRTAVSYLRSRPDIQDVIVNGDIFDGPSLTALAPEQKIDLLAGFLSLLQKTLARKIYFNFGNHDENYDFSQKPPALLREFSERLAGRIGAMSNEGIFLIGTESRQVYDYRIGDIAFAISHSPFVTTPELNGQVVRIPEVQKPDGTWANHPAVNKIVQQPLLSEEQSQDGKVRVFSDNHTPLIDAGNRVYDTGKLTFDKTLQLEPSSFLILDSQGFGKLYQVTESQAVIELDPRQVACRYAVGGLR